MVVDSLLHSLNQPESEIDRKGAAVAKRRLTELRSGSVETVPGDGVFEKTWKKLNKKKAVSRREFLINHCLGAVRRDF